MQGFFDMVIVQGGVPLLNTFSNFAKHILNGMLRVDIGKRFSSLHALR